MGNFTQQEFDAAKAAIKPDSAEPQMKITKAPPMWLGKHPILDASHAYDLEQAAAINEFHRKMPRDQAEAAAHEEYRKTHHAKAAAHHFAGMRAAQGAGDMDEAKQHGDLYAQHMKALGEDPYGPVPEHIRLQASDPKHTKVYRFANHGADQFLGQHLGKSEGEVHSECSERSPCPGCGAARYKGLKYPKVEEMQKVAPPGFSEKTMHALKRKHGVESAFKIAWAAYEKGKGHHEAKKSLKKAPDRFELLDLDTPGHDPQAAFKKPAAPAAAPAPARPQGSGARRAQQDAAFERQQMAAAKPTVRQHTFTPAADPMHEAAMADQPAPEDTAPERFPVDDPRRYYHCEDCGDYHDIYGGVKDRTGREIGRYRPMIDYDDQGRATPESLQRLAAQYNNDPAVLDYYGLKPATSVAKTERLGRLAKTALALLKATKEKK